MYRKSIAQKIGEYDTSLFCAEDFDYWCRLAMAGNITYLTENLYVYRMHSNNLSSTKSEIVRQKTSIIQAKYAEALFRKYNVNKKEQAELFYIFYKRNPMRQDFIAKAVKLSPIKIGVRYFLYLIRELSKDKGGLMLKNFDINCIFKKYSNKYEILQGIQVNDEFIAMLNSSQSNEKISIKAEGLKFIFEFRNHPQRQFVELRVRNWLNITSFIGYKGDYIVRDKTGVYILPKEKFENQYELL